MADINIERKGPPLWLILLAALALAIAVWAALRVLTREAAAASLSPRPEDVPAALFRSAI